MTKTLLTVALLCASLSLQGTGSAHASNDASQPDQVIQWNRTLLQILQTPGAQPATIHPTRSMAIVHLAIYDAVNGIRGGHAPYLVLHAPRSASPEAAAAAAHSAAVGAGRVPAHAAELQAARLHELARRAAVRARDR